jgi:hypothetical protein
MDRSFKNDLDKILASTVRHFASEGNVAAVTVLALSKVRIEPAEQAGWNDGLDKHWLTFEVEEHFFAQLAGVGALQDELKEKINAITPQYPHDVVAAVSIIFDIPEDPAWREKARTWISGRGISNQGRARSDHLAPRMCDGLLFRSQPEIHLYRALKAIGISFAPLPVFVRGGQTYRRIEPDFVILKDGVLLIVEVDGDTVHQETPREAHDRVTMLLHEGAHIERINANECETPDKAKECAKRILGIINKLKTNK